METIRVGWKKLAVILFTPVIVRFFGFSVPVKSPVQFAKPQFGIGYALQETTVPESYQLPEVGVTEPLPPGLTAVVN